ncbi:hypothetical protein CYMTET_47958 [Cymbomonas tetramitiformis]|uniref:Uncharacterized protein n=1 Tax=Cymbomonas tetramitiformis TaxID=36881 RepID=A0AAE0BUK7_9CHLO|nr:hypothetical protein CYMTET_47958 [Cymbomonas tetramitiformis]
MSSSKTSLEGMDAPEKSPILIRDKTSFVNSKEAHHEVLADTEEGGGDARKHLGLAARQVAESIEPLNVVDVDGMLKSSGVEVALHDVLAGPQMNAPQQLSSPPVVRRAGSRDANALPAPQCTTSAGRAG